MIKNYFRPEHIVLALTVFIFAFVAVPFVTFNQLDRWDAIGHVFSAEFTSNEFFPNFSGWNLLSFSGFGQNYFYPPLFYWLTAALHLVMPIDVAIKLLLVLSFLLIPYSAYFLGKKFKLSDEKSAIYSILVTAGWLIPNTFFNVGGLGGNLASTINVGLYPNGFVLPFILFTIGIIWESLETNRWKLAGVLIAICILTHYIGGLLLIFLLVLSLYFRSQEKILTAVKIGGLSLLLSSFWLIKGILFQNEWFSVPIIKIDGIGFVVFFALTLIPLIFRLIKKKSDEVDWVIGFLLGALLVAYLFIFPIHYYRFLIPIGIFTLLLVVKTISEKNFWRLSIFLIIAMVASLGNIDFSGETGFEQISPLPDSRTLFTSKDTPREFYHYPRYALQRQGVELAKGLFVESSRMSRYYSVVESEINPNAFIWGDYAYSQIIDPAIISWPLIESQLDQLGVSYIITDQADLPIGSRKIFAIHHVTNKQNLLERIQKNPDRQDITYYLYELQTSLLAEEIKNPIFYPDENTFNQAASELFFMVDPPTLIQSEPFTLAVANETVKIELEKKSNELLELNIDSNEPVLVQLKYVHFPNWHAYQDGKEIPIYVSTPRMMSVYAKGKVEFRFEQSIVEYFFFVVSVLTVIGLILLELIRQKKLVL